MFDHLTGADKVCLLFHGVLCLTGLNDGAAGRPRLTPPEAIGQGCTFNWRLSRHWWLDGRPAAVSLRGIGYNKEKQHGNKVL
jgi:hypothetical protein